jgi:hypothetical protein
MLQRTITETIIRSRFRSVQELTFTQLPATVWPRLEWDVEQTITHMIGATAKYTLYLASRCEHFIGLSITRWPDATNQEVIDSIVPVARGLATVAAATPPGVRAYHVTGPSSPAGYVARACAELLVHTDDALSGLGVAFTPPADLCQRVLAQRWLSHDQQRELVAGRHRLAPATAWHPQRPAIS